MTSASELFYNRRSRIGRETPELGLGFGSSVDRNHHNLRHRRYYHYRFDVEGFDPSQPSPHARRHSDHEPVRLERATGQSATSNSGISRETSSSRTNRPRLTRNDRLPGSVLLARERLLERLRGVSLYGNRQSNRASSSISWDEFASGDDFDWETETLREWPMRGGIQTDSKKKPPGLGEGELNNLKQKVFRYEDKGDEGVLKFVGEECSICLERFLVGEKVICLPCDHRFHYECLDPWVRNCGDCPYCRTGIVERTNL